MNKEEIIQKYINENKWTSYLEIGSQSNVNFNLIKCRVKVSVDPDPDTNPTFKGTSDEYFKSHKEKFDIIFVDGLHHADQVEQDIINSSKVLNENGAIFIHDLNPTLEIQTLVPRQNKQWTGDCYRAMVGFRQKYPEVESYTYAADWGLGVIFPKGQMFESGFISDIRFSEFMEYKEDLLNLV